MAHVVQQVTHRPEQGGDGANDEGAEEKQDDGDATSAVDLNEAPMLADVSFYLIHSMSKTGDVRAEELSEHLGSRVEVGEVFLDSSVLSAALQAGVVLGKERDFDSYVGTPPGGNQTFAAAVAAANEGTDTRRWQKTLGTVGADAVLPPRGPVP